MNDITTPTPNNGENALAAAEQSNTFDMYSNRETMKFVFDTARMLSKTELVPQSYRGKPENCVIAIDMANRMGVSPMFVMQNLYVVKGKPSWSGQACMSLIQACGKFENIKTVYFGEQGTDKRGCRVTAKRISDGDTVEGPEVTLTMARAEGWTNNPKWRNMPELMLAYRAAAFFARIYCPDALMGVQTAEENEDVFARTRKTKAPDVLGGDNNADK